MSSLDLLDLIEEREDKIRWAKEAKEREEYQRTLKPKPGMIAINEKGLAGLIQSGSEKTGYKGIFLTGKIKEGWLSKKPRCIVDIQHVVNIYDRY